MNAKEDYSEVQEEDAKGGFPCPSLFTQEPRRSRLPKCREVGVFLGLGSGVEGELVEEQGIWRGGRATANFISLILNRYNYLLLLIKVLHINNL